MKHKTRLRQLAIVLTVVFACVSFSQVSISLSDEIDFERDIMPIFKESCVDCHGPEEQESGFRVDSRPALLLGGDYGEPAIVPGDIAKSLLITAVEYEDSDFEMPPSGKLSDEKIQLLKQWVKEGAVWPGQMEAKIERKKSDHWSFQPVVRPDVPKIESRFPVRNEIDSFLQAKLAYKGISPAAESDPRTLIRRVSIVLTGLPPTPEQVASFRKVYSSNPDEAYSALVERLLSSESFGERFAQHWLDVIRWSETNGSESNMYRKNAWVYRDYVIRSFNEDKPYDDFVREQLAGDVLGAGDATGFLVSGPHVPAATVGREVTAQRQARADRMDEVMQTVGASMMGVTIGCARCHNHKFDPISIQDYYSMTAAFQDVEFGSRFPEYSADHPRQKRADELRANVAKQRNTMLKTGPWIESSLGYDELHFYPTEATAVRIEFLWPNIRIDELEFFGKKQGIKNLIDYRENVTATHNPDVAESKDFPNINDGEYGTMAWGCKSGKKQKSVRPWVEFEFAEPKSIDRMRISTNREDSMVTDYLTKLNPKNFGEYVVKVKTAAGEWKQVAHSKNIQNQNKSKPERTKAIAEIQSLLQQLSEEGPRQSFVGRFVRPGKTFVLRRGSPENKGDEVLPAGLTELDGELGLDSDAAGEKRRIAFANWLIQKEHPLTSRVMVNRIWHHVFGQGIVTTTSDFGKAGTLPTHPELLDWLASEFVEPRGEGKRTAKPWSMKHMIRMMVMSHAFRQQSTPRKDCLAVDSNAALLWRYPPKRMEAEVIRDSIIKASDSLDPTVGGRSYRIHNVKKRYAQWVVVDNHSENTWRRLIYQERMRRVDDKNFTAFDFPDCGQIRARRPVSTTPLQALNLMNSDFVVEQSKLIAERATKESDGDKAALNRCFQLLLNRDPAKDETELCLQVAKEEGLEVVCRALINSNEFAFLP
ncbi:MAG: PSD1 and planctomycete cytochrome C domain-containing protein [Mariniblastus sp.]